jgi:hypothetical protein
MRKSDLYFIVILALGTAFFMILSVYPSRNACLHQTIMENQKREVRKLHLTDLCLFTEARYARHLSQADLHSAFQDHPMAMDHFPSGSLVMPPQHLTSNK